MSQSLPPMNDWRKTLPPHFPSQVVADDVANARLAAAHLEPVAIAGAGSVCAGVDVAVARGPRVFDDDGTLARSDRSHRRSSTTLGNPSQSSRGLWSGNGRQNRRHSVRRPASRWDRSCRASPCSESGSRPRLADEDTRTSQMIKVQEARRCCARPHLPDRIVGPGVHLHVAELEAPGSAASFR